MKKFVSLFFFFVILFIFICCASAETVIIDSLTDEQLNQLHNAVHDELLRRQELSGKQYPMFDGEDRVCVYENEFIDIYFTGFYKWTDDWYIPKVIITNKTPSSLWFRWDDIYINNCKMGAANGGEQEILANGRLSLPAENLCSITLQDYIDLYGDTIINTFSMKFTLRDGSIWSDNYKTLVDEDIWNVYCSIDITELMH